MPKSLHSTTHGAGGSSTWLGRGAFAALVASVIGLCVMLAVNGPRIRAAAEAEEARIVAAEDQALCSKLGVGPESARYAECAVGLKEIRTRALQRSVSEFGF